MHAEVAARASLFRHKLAGHRFGLVGKLQGDGVVGVAGEQAGGAVGRHAERADTARPLGVLKPAGHGERGERGHHPLPTSPTRGAVAL